MVEYKQPFDLELNDEGIYRGKKYKLLSIEQGLHATKLTLCNGREEVRNVLADEFAVRVDTHLSLDQFAELYKQAKALKYI